MRQYDTSALVALSLANVTLPAREAVSITLDNPLQQCTLHYTIYGNTYGRLLHAVRLELPLPAVCGIHVSTAASTLLRVKLTAAFQCTARKTAWLHFAICW